MAEQRAAYGSDWFWTIMSWGSGLIAGGIIGYVFSDIYGAGRTAGLFVGGVVFLTSGWIFNRFAVAPNLPPPNSVRIDVAPAPTVSGGSHAAARAAEPSPTVAEFATEVKEKAQEAVASVWDAAEAGNARVTAAVISATGSERAAEPEERDDRAAISADEPEPQPSAPVAEPEEEEAGNVFADAPAEAAAAPAGEAAPAEPVRMDAPRAGGADDLTRIRGIGPELQGMLNGMGIFHFDQIAQWTEAELAWADTRIEAFPGRARRDDWVGQSRHLAAFGATNAPEREDKGEV